MPLPSGTQFGPYAILDRIGVGGMGEVYRAQDPRLGRKVAIKVLPPSFAEEPERLRRFELEARTLAQLNHPNVVHVHDCGVFEGQFFLVMELLEGESLRKRLDGGPLGVRKAMDIALQVGRGLAAAHAKGIIHRDLKPENIFLVKDGRVKLLDFGLAKAALLPTESSTGLPGVAMDSQGQMAVTQQGVMLGTAGYMSPEQVRGETLDPRSDIFAFGVVLFEMVSGRRPFAGANVVDSLHAILHAEPPDLQGISNFPPMLDRVIHRCLEKDPEARFHHVPDLLFALEQVLPQPSTSGSGQALEPPKSRIPISGGLLASLAALLLLGAALLWARPKAPAFTRLTPFPSVIHTARFLPDGKSVVYSAGVDGKAEDVYLMPAAGGQPYPLGVKGGGVMSVSPTGDVAVLLRRVPFHAWGDLAVLPASGGTPKKIMEDVGWAEWGPDGKSLVVHRHFAQDTKPQSITYQGRTIIELTSGFEPDSFSFALSPKKDKLAFLERRARNGTLVVVTLEGKVLHRTPLKFQADHLKWTPAGLYAICGSLDGLDGCSLAKLDPDSGHLKVLYRAMGGMTLFDVSREGAFLLSRNGKRESWIGFTNWKKPDQAQETTLSWGYWAQKPALSADGMRLAFSSSSFYESPEKSLLAEALADPKEGSFTVLGEGSLGSLSPDGKWALNVVMNEKGHSQFRLLPTGPGEDRAIPGEWSHISDQIHFFRDNQRLLLRGRKAGEKDLCSWILDLASGATRKLDGDVHGPISPDGRWAVAWEGNTMNYTYRLFDLESGTLKDFPEAWKNLRPSAWSRDGKGLWMWRRQSRRGFPLEIWLGDPFTGKGEKTRDLSGPEVSTAYFMGTVAMSDDGQSLAYDYFFTYPVPTDLYRLSGPN